MSAERSRLAGLYAITPEDADTGRLASRVAACLEGGAAIVQYRAKSLALQVKREQAAQLARLCRSHGALFIVNDAVDLALESGADGVHLGRGDGDVRKARESLGAAIIGVSCYDDPSLARRAASEGADYCAIGSVFASSTKPGAVRAPLALIAEARRVSGLPIVAIGGITDGNAAHAIAAGADMVAVISALFDAPDPQAAARAIARLFERSPETNDVRTQPRAL